MKKILVLIALFGLIFSFTTADDNQYSSEITQTYKGLFNERGYLKSSSTYIADGNEMVNNYNGNLTYRKTLCSQSVKGGKGISLTLSYNGSVSHSMIVSYPGETTYMSGQTLNISAPEWILSINGIPFHVFSMNNTAYSLSEITQGSSENSPMIGSTPLYVDGFHKTNSKYMTSGDMSGNGEVCKLFTKVLTEDGGTNIYAPNRKFSFENNEYGTFSNGSLEDNALYLPLDKENKSKAFMYGNSEGYSREFIVFNSDGSKTTYQGNILDTKYEPFSEMTLNEQLSYRYYRPYYFIPKKYEDASGNVIIFTYHDNTDPMDFYAPKENGIPLIKSISVNGHIYDFYFERVHYYNSYANVSGFHIIAPEKIVSLDLNWANCGSAYISKITEYAGSNSLITNFEYENYENRVNFKLSSNDNRYFKMRMKRLSKIRYPEGGLSTFEYYSPNYVKYEYMDDTSISALEYKFTDNNLNHDINDFKTSLVQYGRDFLSVNMLKNKKTYLVNENNEEELIKTIEFTFTSSGNVDDSDLLLSGDNIPVRIPALKHGKLDFYTERIVTGYHNDIPDDERFLTHRFTYIEKPYNEYNLFGPESEDINFTPQSYSSRDSGWRTKLISSEKKNSSENAWQTEVNTWDFGVEDSDGFYTGTFRLSNKQVIEKLSNQNTSHIVSSESYTYNPDPDYLHLLLSSVKRVECGNDIVETKTIYSNYFSTKKPDDMKKIYMPELPVETKVYNLVGMRGEVLNEVNVQRTRNYYNCSWNNTVEYISIDHTPYIQETNTETDNFSDIADYNFDLIKISELGNLIKTRNYRIDSDEYIETNYEYSGSTLTSAIDSEGNEIHYYYNAVSSSKSGEFYNASGGKWTRLTVKLKDPDNNNNYNDFNVYRTCKINGSVKKQEGANGEVSRFVYDTVGRIKEVYFPNNTSGLPDEKYIYNVHKNEVEIYKRLHGIQFKKEVHHFDGLGRIIRTDKYLDVETDDYTFSEFNYWNHNNQIKEAIDFKGNKTFSDYDYLGRPVEQKLYSNSNSPIITKYYYNYVQDISNYPEDFKNEGFGTVFLETKTEMHGKTVSEYKNSLGKKLAVKTSLNPDEYAETFYNYNMQGNLITLQKPEGQREEYRYDNKNNLIELTNQADGLHEKYFYNDLNQMIYKQTGNLESKEQLIKYKIDGMGRLLEEGTINGFIDSENNSVSFDPATYKTAYEYNYDIMSIEGITDNSTPIINNDIFTCSTNTYGNPVNGIGSLIELNTDDYYIAEYVPNNYSTDKYVSGYLSAGDIVIDLTELADLHGCDLETKLLESVLNYECYDAYTLDRRYDEFSSEYLWNRIEDTYKYSINIETYNSEDQRIGRVFNFPNMTAVPGNSYKLHIGDILRNAYKIDGVKIKIRFKYFDFGGAAFKKNMNLYSKVLPNDNNLIYDELFLENRLNTEIGYDDNGDRIYETSYKYSRTGLVLNENHFFNELNSAYNFDYHYNSAQTLLGVSYPSKEMNNLYYYNDRGLVKQISEENKIDFDNFVNEIHNETEIVEKTSENPIDINIESMQEVMVDESITATCSISETARVPLAKNDINEICILEHLEASLDFSSDLTIPFSVEQYGIEFRVVVYNNRYNLTIVPYKTNGTLLPLIAIEYETEDLGSGLDSGDFSSEITAELSETNDIMELLTINDDIAGFEVKITYIADINASEIVNPGSAKDIKIPITYQYSIEDVNVNYEFKKNLTYNTSSTELFSMEYDANDKISRLAYPNGIEAEYSYDSNDRLAGLNYSFSHMTLLDLGYDYDRRGNITTIRSGSKVMLYDYDLSNRLVREKTFDNNIFEYTYDKNGNREKVVANSTENYYYTYYGEGTEPSNRLETANGVHYSYDRNGNVNLREKSALESDRFTYDYRNLVTDYTKTSSEIPKPIGRIAVKGIVGGDKTGTQPIVKRESYEYTYNAAGKRIRKKDLQTGETRYYIYANTEPVCEIDEEGNIEKEYLYFSGKKIKERDYKNQKNSYFHTDHLGSLRLITEDGGKIIWEADYYAFGQQFATRSRESRFNYGFTGKEFDPESGLNYHGARFMDSKIGRFLQVDPLSVKYPAESPYHYCSNNPIIYVDLDGNEKMEFTVKIGYDYQRSDLNSRETKFHVYRSNDNKIKGLRFKINMPENDIDRLARKATQKIVPLFSEFCDAVSYTISGVSKATNIFIFSDQEIDVGSNTENLLKGIEFPSSIVDHKNSLKVLAEFLDTKGVPSGAIKQITKAVMKAAKELNDVTGDGFDGIGENEKKKTFQQLEREKNEIVNDDDDENDEVENEYWW